MLDVDEIRKQTQYISFFLQYKYIKTIPFFYIYIAEKPNVDTLDSVLSGLVGGMLFTCIYFKNNTDSDY